MVRYCIRLHVPEHQLDAQWLGTGAQHVDALRGKAGVHEEALAVLVLLDQLVVEHQHGLGDGGALVQQGSIGDRQAREVGHHGLEIQECLQAPLADLRLVGRVGRVPSGVLEYVPADDRRRDGAAVT